MTRQEQVLAEQKAKLQERSKALKQQEKILDVRLEQLARRRTARRQMAVGRLVEAAGLLWYPDDVLEKWFAGLAEAVG
jgi:hypothetical protein